MSVKSIQRRTFLKAAGITIALPTLESYSKVAAAEKNPHPPRRLVCIGNEFGMYPGAFWPKTFGSNYEITPLLKPLELLRKEFSLLSHLDHGLNGGHFAIHAFLTGVKAAEARALPDGGISLDQRAAEFVGAKTRFPSLTIGSETGLHGGCRMSWTRRGTRVPPIQGPRELFRALFVEKDRVAKAKEADRILAKASILDAVIGDAKSLKRRINPSDEQKLDEYFSSVREVEMKLDLQRQWQTIPKPTTEMNEPQNRTFAGDLPLLYDLMILALQTDSTRVATLEIGGSFVARDIGINKGYHGLSHHGMLQQNIDLLVQIELYQMQQFARFLEKMRAVKEPNNDGSLLDQSMVLAGSGMGNANSHTNRDLPLILAGGGFKHGAHLQFPDENRKRVPLCNLFVSLLQRFGVETEQFGTSSGTLTGLEA